MHVSPGGRYAPDTPQEDVLLLTARVPGPAPNLPTSWRHTMPNPPHNMPDWHWDQNLKSNTAVVPPQGLPPIYIIIINHMIILVGLGETTGPCLAQEAGCGAQRE